MVSHSCGCECVGRGDFVVEIVCRILETNRDTGVTQCGCSRVVAASTFACMTLGRSDSEHTEACLSVALTSPL